MSSARQLCESDDQAAATPLEFIPQAVSRPAALQGLEPGVPSTLEADRREASMLDCLRKLIESLREELKNYGEMLALLDRQQEYLLTRAASEVSLSIDLVTAQGNAINNARDRRENCRREVAKAAGQEEEICFANLIPQLPPDYQPLLQALVDENNELLSRVRRRARQNHLMLKRSVELMQEVLNSLRIPGHAPVCIDASPLPIRLRETRPLQEETN
jgi:flagellar biosynthesis/type III secretory pathway chaperone